MNNIHFAIKIKFLVSFFFIAFHGSGLKIQVVDSVSGVGIPYVSFVHLVDGKGSFGDENGYVTIDYKINELYEFSSVGYVPKRLIPSQAEKRVVLRQSITQLPEVTIIAEKSKQKLLQIGQIKKNTFTPFYSSLPRKMILLNYLPAPVEHKEWVIRSIKLGIGANKSKIYKSFLIRLVLRKGENGVPSTDLLTKDWVVEITSNSFGYTFDLEEFVILPKDGCFVGFETVGRIKKDGTFVPYSDFYFKPEESFQFFIRRVKSDLLSLFKMGSFNAWFNNKAEEDRPSTYAIAIDVYENL